MDRTLDRVREDLSGVNFFFRRPHSGIDLSDVFGILESVQVRPNAHANKFLLTFRVNVADIAGPIPDDWDLGRLDPTDPDSRLVEHGPMATAFNQVYVHRWNLEHPERQIKATAPNSYRDLAFHARDQDNATVTVALEQYLTPTLRNGHETAVNALLALPTKTGRIEWAIGNKIRPKKKRRARKPRRREEDLALARRFDNNADRLQERIRLAREEARALRRAVAALKTQEQQAARPHVGGKSPRVQALILRQVQEHESDSDDYAGQIQRAARVAAQVAAPAVLGKRKAREEDADPQADKRPRVQDVEANVEARAQPRVDMQDAEPNVEAREEAPQDVEPRVEAPQDVDMQDAEPSVEPPQDAEPSVEAPQDVDMQDAEPSVEAPQDAEPSAEASAALVGEKSQCLGTTRSGAACRRRGVAPFWCAHHADQRA